MEDNCKNCDVELHPDYLHCPKCGQRTRLHRLSLHDLIHETVHYFTHADKGLFQLIRDLIVKRGEVAREFVEGRRKKYFPPLNFFFLVAAFYVLTASLHDDYGKVDVFAKHPELHSISDPVEKANAIEVYKRVDSGTHYIKKYGNFVAMISLPLTAFVFWLFYRRGRYNYIEHLVACMFMYSLVTLAFTFALLLNMFLGFNENYIHGFFLFVNVAYYAIFYYRFMGGCTTAKAWKAFAVSVMSLVVLWAFSWAIMLTYIYGVFG